MNDHDNTIDASTCGTNRRGFLRSGAAVAGVAALAHAAPVGPAAAATNASRFEPLDKAVRLADTRFPIGHRFDPSDAVNTNRFERSAPNRLRVPVLGRAGVPSNATAVVLTVTAKNRAVPNNYVTFYPDSANAFAQPPAASNLNLPRANEVSANLAFVKVGPLGGVSVFQFAACETIVDVLGYFVPQSGKARAGRFKQIGDSGEAKRVYDSRPGYVGAGSFTPVDVTSAVPAEAASAIVNLTVVGNTTTGWFSAVPYSVTATPTTSSLNVFFPFEQRAAAAIVPVEKVGSRRLIKVYASIRAKLIVDVSGYFTNESARESTTGLFVPTDPTRVLDTRVPDDADRMWPRWVVEQTVPSVSSVAGAIAINVTSARTRSPGYLTVSPAWKRIPETSNVNWNKPYAIVPNMVVTPLSGKGFQAYNSSGGHVIADMAGYFLGTPLIEQATYRYTNPPPPAIRPEWTLRVPKLGLTSRVLEGNSVFITDSGHTWHWAGTGFMGQTAHVAVFGHRTEAGGPYRNLHLLGAGDTWTVTTSDRRIFTYKYKFREVTSPDKDAILAATRRVAGSDQFPGTTFSFVACTVGYDSTKSAYPDIWAPTSLKWRIVVTGELVSWRQF